MSTALSTRLDQRSLSRFGKGDHKRAQTYVMMTAAFLEGRTKNTRTTYATALVQFFGLFDWIAPEDVTIAHGAAFKKWLLERKKVSEATAYWRLSALRSYFDFLCLPPSAGGDPLIRSNPIRHVPRGDIKPTPYSNARAMPWEDFIKILKAIPSTPSGMRNKAILLFYAYTGRRRAEVVGLRMKDLDVKSRPRTYRARLKGGRVQTFELPELVYEAMQAYWITSDRLRDLHQDSPVFASYHLDGETSAEHPICMARANRILMQAAKRAGVDLNGASIHSIRHMFARDLDKGGVPLQDIQEALGHLTPNTTAIYLGRLGRVAPSHVELLDRVRSEAAKEAYDATREPD